MTSEKTNFVLLASGAWCKESTKHIQVDVDLYRAFVEILESLDGTSCWIDAAEKTPPQGEDGYSELVLGVAYGEVGIYYYSPKNVWREREYSSDEVDVTLWMPLPEPPEQEKI